MADMTIGRLAKTAGVHVETIRYYQRRGLMEAPRRASRAVRRYDEGALRRLRFIRRAQVLGFTLAEIGELLRLERTPDCGRARKLASAKLADVEGKLDDLERMRGTLRRLVQACAAGRDPRSCPIVDSLASETGD